MNLVNEVIFPFRTHLACFFRALLTLAGDKVLKRDSLRTNEALLKVGVDLTGRVRRSRTDRDDSRVHFFHARGEVGLQAEHLMARADHAVQTLLGHEIFTIGVVHFSDIGFNRVPKRYHYRTFIA